MNATKKTITVTAKPVDTEAYAVGTIAKVVDANGIYWGTYKLCRNWCHEVFWMEWFA